MDAPTGTVTLVFTDVQGSTDLWESMGDAFGAVLTDHNTLMRELIAEHSGYEVKTEGDAFMVAFADAPDAVRWALAVQERMPGLEAAKEQGVDIRVRIGAHTGEPICEADPTSGRMDYFGPMVNRAARIGSAGHGGQILLSDRCCEESAGAARESGAVLTELGQFRFKGLSRSERVHQVLPASQADRTFPKIASLDEAQTNMPELGTTFVGRERETQEVSELLLDGKTRLLTLSGPGGIGKTRLSLRVGSEVLDRFEGGVWFCDLTEAWSEDAVCQAVASALSVPLPAGKAPADAIASILEFRKPLLLIFDNFEQVAEHSKATVGLWLRKASNVSVLTSSRVLLGIAGEREYRLEPLSMPPTGAKALTDTRALASYDVVRLFVERAREAKPAFELGPDNAREVAEICVALEGMPLAIELAAARVRLMDPAQMTKKLNQKFKLLRSSRRDLPARQQTLTGAIDWSYDLLSDWERAALCQVCAFRGGFFLEAAEEVIDLEEFDDAPFGIDAIEVLRDYSLLTTSETPLGTRIRMYVAIREYAEEKIDENIGDEGKLATEQRHAAHYVSYAEEWDERRGSEDAIEAFDRLELEVENLFAVQDRSLEWDEVNTAARAILALAVTMAVRGLSTERVPRLERALGAVREADAGDTLLEVRLMTALCLACQDRGEWDKAAEIAESSVGMAESIGAEQQRGSALIQRAEMHRLRGDLEGALVSFDDAAELFEAIGDTSALGRSVGGRGAVLWKMGRYEEAIECFTKAAELFEETGNKAGQARNVSGRGIILAELHDYDGAIRCYEEAESMHRLMGNHMQLAKTLGNKAIVQWRRGDADQALATLDQAEKLNREQGSTASVARNIGIRGQVLQELGRLEEALACFEDAEGIHRKLGNPSGIASNLSRRGHALARLGRNEEAAAPFEEAAATFDQIGEGSTRESYECRVAHAICLDALGDADSAREAAVLALHIAEDTGLVNASESDEELGEQLGRLRGLAGRS